MSYRRGIRCLIFFSPEMKFLTNRVSNDETTAVAPRRIRWERVEPFMMESPVSLVPPNSGVHRRFILRFPCHPMRMNLRQPDSRELFFSAHPYLHFTASSMASSLLLARAKVVSSLLVAPSSLRISCNNLAAFLFPSKLAHSWRQP